MTPANDTAARNAIGPDHRVKVYEARHGLIWSAGGGSVRSITEAEAALPAMIDLALTERERDLSGSWLLQLCDLISAIRDARRQAKASDAQALTVAA